MAIRLLVCDDHEVIRKGLAALLAGTNIEIVGEAATGKEALEQAEKTKPDVILLDIRMPDDDGLVTLDKLRSKVPASRVVMLSTYDNPTYIARAVALGASDYVLKGSARDDIIATITAAADGESPSRSGEFRRIAGAMQVRQAIDDDFLVPALSMGRSDPRMNRRRTDSREPPVAEPHRFGEPLSPAGCHGHCPCFLGPDLAGGSHR